MTSKSNPSFLWQFGYNQAQQTDQMRLICSIFGHLSWVNVLPASHPLDEIIVAKVCKAGIRFDCAKATCRDGDVWH